MSDIVADWQAGGFGLYVHWPFCQAKCPYCDFNSHVSDHIDQARWLRAYLSELDRVGQEVGRRPLRSIYFGGGTPSLMEPSTVAAIIERAGQHWDFANDIEITLEANPTSTEASRFSGYRDGGVNRISMGFQALNDEDLRKLGRLHNVEEGLEAFQLAQSFFPRTSFDLIYARQDQTLQQWTSELATSLALASDHLSLYQLTIEPNTAFGARHARGGLRGLPNDDVASDMFFKTIDMCGDAGLEHYEVSNFAKPGSESRHNLIYWRYGDFVGIGPGAHGRITLGQRKFGTSTYLMPDEWLAHVEKNGSGELIRDEISRSEQADEYAIMGLRLKEGISLSRLEGLREKSIDRSKINDLSSMSMVTLEDDTLSATNDGRVVLNSVLKELLSD